MTDQLDAALARVEHEITRTDNKASLLLAFTGAAVAGIISAAAAAHLNLATKLIGAAAGALLLLAADTLLCVVRPNLSGKDRSSFPHWATCTQDEIRQSLDTDTRPAQIQVLSPIATVKFRRLRSACDLLRGAVALLALAAALTAL